MDPRSAPVDPEQQTQRVTPYLLRRADTMCARRLDAEFSGRRGSSDPVNRARVREAFLDRARVAHTELRSATLDDFSPPDLEPPDLEQEERAVVAHAARWYVELFRDRPGQLALHDCDSPTEARDGVRLGGWVDLTLVGADGVKELRQFELWGGAARGDDVLDHEAVKLALARLHLTGWLGDEPVRAVWADLVNGRLRERLVEPEALGGLRAWYRDRLAVVRARVATPVEAPGSDCASCRFPARCPAHPTGAFGMGPRHDLRPGVLAISPSSLERWRDCRRMWRNRNLLQVPWSDDAGSTAWGLRVHRALQEVHAGGSCHDDVWIEHVLTAHGADDDEMRGYLARHARRCPAGAESLGHEVEMARFHRTPLPLFMATARLDAVWVHDGVLDVRDYKTGRAWYERVVDDPGARLQAWVAAPLARERGLALQIRYEQLAAEVVDDPEPFEATPEDLETIEAELLETVTAMWAEQGFAGVADPASCVRCGYRSICPDSASPATPNWPEPPEAEVV